MKNNNILVVGRAISNATQKTGKEKDKDFVTFKIAVADNDSKQGDPVKTTDFEFLCYGNMAITALKIVKKGQSLTVHGHIRTFVDAATNMRQYLFIADSVGLNMLSHIDRSPAE